MRAAGLWWAKSHRFDDVHNRLESLGSGFWVRIIKQCPQDQNLWKWSEGSKSQVGKRLSCEAALGDVPAKLMGTSEAKMAFQSSPRLGGHGQIFIFLHCPAILYGLPQEGLWLWARWLCRWHKTWMAFVTSLTVKAIGQQHSQMTGKEIFGGRSGGTSQCPPKGSS